MLRVSDEKLTWPRLPGKLYKTGVSFVTVMTELDWCDQ